MTILDVSNFAFIDRVYDPRVDFEAAKEVAIARAKEMAEQTGSDVVGTPGCVEVLAVVQFDLGPDPESTIVTRFERTARS